MTMEIEEILKASMKQFLVQQAYTQAVVQELKEEHGIDLIEGVNDRLNDAAIAFELNGAEDMAKLFRGLLRILNEKQPQRSTSGPH